MKSCLRAREQATYLRHKSNSEQERNEGRKQERKIRKKERERERERKSAMVINFYELLACTTSNCVRESSFFFELLSGFIQGRFELNRRAAITKTSEGCKRTQRRSGQTKLSGIRAERARTETRKTIEHYRTLKQTLRSTQTQSTCVRMRVCVGVCVCVCVCVR